MTCPNCGEECTREEVDVGPGVIPAGPWTCEACEWTEEPPAWLAALVYAPAPE